MNVAFVRPVPDSFTRCVTARPAVPPLDPEVARAQHAAYAAALAAGGFEVHQVPAAPDHPDSPFVEDAAVVLGGRALITRPGHPSRRGETGGVRTMLQRWMEVAAVVEEGTIDGGDVLQVGGRVLVGLSPRTDAAGVEALRRFAAPVPVVAVPVRDTLHLKSGLSAVDDATVLWHPAACDRGALDGVTVIPVPGDDPEAANVVRLPDGSILANAAHPGVAAMLAAAGRRVVTVDVSEFGRADGGLTCLSLRLRTTAGVSSKA